MRIGDEYWLYVVAVVVLFQSLITIVRSATALRAPDVCLCFVSSWVENQGTYLIGSDIWRQRAKPSVLTTILFSVFLPILAIFPSIFLLILSSFSLFIVRFR